MCFENKYVNYFNIARNLGDPEIIKFFPKTTAKISFTRIFNFKKYVNNLNLDAFSINPHTLQRF